MFRRDRSAFVRRAGLVVALMVAGGFRVTDAAAEPSPFAPNTLKAPIFDTQTPRYGARDQQARSAATVVAEVDGRAVTLGDVGDAVAELPPSVKGMPFAELFPNVLDQLVRQQALVVRAQRQALDDNPVVRRKIKAATERVLMNAVLEQEISRSITEAALLDRYNREFAGKPGPEEAHVRVIMVASEQEAAEIIGELRGGADFATVARRSSKDATAVSGGDAGWVTRDTLTAEVGAVVFCLPPGQVTAYPVRSADAWFVLKLEERRVQPTRSFSAMREALRQILLRQGVADVVNAALRDVTVREYDVNGKEAAEPASSGESRVAR